MNELKNLVVCLKKINSLKNVLNTLKKFTKWQVKKLLVKKSEFVKNWN